MRKPSKKIGVGQLTLTLDFGSKDDAQETEDNGSMASSAASVVRSKPERKRKRHSLIDKVYAVHNLQAAWERVRANRGAGGVDGASIALFSRNVEGRLLALHEDLRAKTYRPQPVRRVYIPKSGGGKRPLGIPTVRDRIVQQALLQVLGPVFEAKFSSRSHGFRPGRGCASALDVVDRAIRHGYQWVVDADVRAFFDSVDHATLLTLLNEEVADGTVLRLIRRILKAGVVEPGADETEPTELGTPQGGPLSPLLANVYLHRLDEQMQEARLGLVRYADDFVIFAKSESEARQALELARAVLEDELSLSLHPEKTRVVSVDDGFEFLGFHYFRHPKKGIQCKEVRRKSVKRFREAVRQRTPRLRTQRPIKARHVTPKRLAANKRITEMLHQLNLFLRGWHWYFKDVRTYYDPPFDRFDRFVRTRIRLAIVGRVGNGWWTVRIPNLLLERLGLVPLAELDRHYRSGVLAAPVRKEQLDGEPYAGKPHVRFG